MRVSTFTNRHNERKLQIVLSEQEIPAYVAGDLASDIAKGLKAALKAKPKGE